MDTSGVGIGDGTQISNLLQTNYQTPTLPQDATTAIPGTTDTSDQSSMSQGGQLMNELQSLQSSDPSKFKTVTQDIANGLSAQAKSSSTSQQNKMLADLAAKFSTASQTGSMSGLQLGHSGHHHGQHKRGSSSSGLGQLNVNGAQAYGNAQNSGAASSMFSTINGIISGALSAAGVSPSTSTASASASSVSAATGTVGGVGGTAV